MTDSSYRYIGAGVYTIAEASRLTHVSRGRIRRWIKRYEHGAPHDRRTSPPVITGQLLDGLESVAVLSFRDLIEIRFVDAFLKHGLTWKVLRVTYARAQEIIGTDHPFCTRRFKTDGHTLFQVGGIRSSSVLDLFQNQLGFAKVISPYLKGLEFEHETITQWWPLGRNQPVVIDGARSFGQPIVFKEGVPTAVLNRAFKAEDSIDRVAEWFRVEKRSVRAAIRYESQLAA
jgi:uncharacterized protein (DUF433 family)